jgi:hypothetical protein
MSASAFTIFARTSSVVGAAGREWRREKRRNRVPTAQEIVLARLRPEAPSLGTGRKGAFSSPD